MKYLILAITLSIIFCSQVWADTGWVLWSQTQVTSSKESTTEWTVDDAFENFKGCKTQADKGSQVFAKGGKGKRLELNAGFDFFLDPKDHGGRVIIMKWLCLPAGTNPMIITKTSSQKNSQ